MAKLPYAAGEIFWVGDSKEQLSSFPLAAKKRLGFGLRQVQNGLMPEIAKPLSGLGSGVYELKANARGDTFRVVYLLKLKKAVYVIDAFQKKSKRGSQTPKEIRERLKRRIAEARRHDDESANGDQTE
jgi:phage-related protein